MKYSSLNLAIALGLVALGVGAAAGGIYLGETDDAPGASLAGILLLIGALVVCVRIGLRKK